MAFGLTRRKAALLLFYGAPILMLHCWDFVSQQMEAADSQWGRDIDVYELFSGCGELGNQCRAAGLNVRKSDISKGLHHDITSSEGFLLSLKNVLRVRYGGLLWCGVPCNSWVWMASSTTKRTTVSYGIMGNEAVPSVAAGNCIAARVALLCMVAIVRGIFWCAEQPGTSCLKDCPYISHVLTSMGPHFFRRMWMGNFDHWASKPSQLWGSWPDVESFSTRLSRAIQKRLQESSKGMYIRKRLPDGRVHVTGGKRLRSSGAYTAGFGKHVAKLLLKRKLQASWLIIPVSVSGSPHNL
ncbi:unnamed protein product [Cladocopium goreaui]|uniref:Uncharacterized protein n=1 Tax=Cladocopium goreaui TaxID=2562237 RepID=A0A9P1BJA3_9DINO|nr:unnamed protein product [Cladocopium goreaui]